MGNCLEVSRGDLGVSFFVPDEISARARDWGWPALERRFEDALGGFARSAGAWLRVVRHRGLAAADGVYQAMLASQVGSPAEARVIDMTGDGGR